MYILLKLIEIFLIISIQDHDNISKSINNQYVTLRVSRSNDCCLKSWNLAHVIGNIELISGSYYIGHIRTEYIATPLI
jgi:hypothetical protein